MASGFPPSLQPFIRQPNWAWPHAAPATPKNRTPAPKIKGGARLLAEVERLPSLAEGQADQHARIGLRVQHGLPFLPGQKPEGARVAEDGGTVGVGTGANHPEIAVGEGGVVGSARPEVDEGEGAGATVVEEVGPVGVRLQ